MASQPSATGTIGRSPIELATALVVETASAFAEACADCEALRIAVPRRPGEWSAAWDRRIALQSQLLDAAKRLSRRETEAGKPPSANVANNALNLREGN